MVEAEVMIEDGQGGLSSGRGEMYDLPPIKFYDKHKRVSVDGWKGFDEVGN